MCVHVCCVCVCVCVCSACRYNTVDVSIAVSTEGGLITPIVFDADDKVGGVGGRVWYKWEGACLLRVSVLLICLPFVLGPEHSSWPKHSLYHRNTPST